MFDWLFKGSNVHRFEDSYAMTRESLWLNLKTSIEKQFEDDRPIWIVCHFANTFSRLQDLLVQWGYEYEISTETVNPQTAARNLSGEDPIQLVLSDLLQIDSTAAVEIRRDTALAMIVIERHPWIENDARVERFAKSLPCSVQFGYFLAIEDPVVKRVVNDMTLKILKQLGMKDHELITSNMITRRLDTVLKREAEGFQTNHRADSAEQWYELNAGDDVNS